MDFIFHFHFCTSTRYWEAITNSIKDFLWNYFVNGGGGLTDFIPLFYFSKHPPNTLQTPCNTLQTPLKHPSTPFKQPSKSSFFSIKKWSEKKINRDFIKGGRGGGSPFYEVVSQKIFFFTIDGFPKGCVGGPYAPKILALPKLGWPPPPNPG